VPAIFFALNIYLSTVSAATDVAFGVGEPLQEIVDVNFQSGPDPRVDARLLLYSAAYHHRYPVPVRSVLFLLRPAADLSHLTGRLAFQAGGGGVEFHHEVVRLWRLPPGPFLTGGPGLLSLAPLCELPEGVPVEEAVREVVHQIDLRLAAEADHGRAVKLMTATFILAGARVGRRVLAEIFRGVKLMYESSAFELYEEKGREEGRQEGLRMGLQEGRVEESHRLLLRLGRTRFGEADAVTEAALRAVRDLDRLERLADAVLTAQSWQELLATP
jgi:hypothetical protein